VRALAVDDDEELRRALERSLRSFAPTEPDSSRILAPTDLRRT
jgi:hypothetical protein